MGTVQQPTQLREVIETLLAEREVMVDAAKVEDVFADANESDKAQSKGKFDVDATEADPRCAAIKLCGPPHLGRLRRECRMLVSPTARPGFSGQQPVSLAQENIESVADDDYLMSWKADGTRYRPTTPLPVAFLNATRFFSVKHSFSNSFSWPCSLSLSASLPLPHARSARLYPKMYQRYLMMIHQGQVYLIGRDNAVFRVPTWAPKSEKNPKPAGLWFPNPNWSKDKPNALHQTILLDGEMVVDVDNTKRERNGTEKPNKRVRWVT
jgi:hypothetical protein